MGKKRFTPEYKEEIIKLVTERKKKISEVARDIGSTGEEFKVFDCEQINHFLMIEVYYD